MQKMNHTAIYVSVYLLRYVTGFAINIKLSCTVLIGVIRMSK